MAMTESLVPIIDISRHQGAIDFAVMRSTGVVGVIIRLGNGRSLDDRAAQYVPEAKAAGLAVGGYWFMNPKADITGADQGHRLVDRAQELDCLDIPPMEDIESYVNEPGPFPIITGSQLQDWLQASTDAIEMDLRYAPLIYSNAAYFNSQHMVAGSMSRCSVIVARYPWYYTGAPHPPANAGDWETWLFNGTTKRPQVPPGWDGWSGWQFAAGYDDVGATYGVHYDGVSDPPDLDLNLIKADAWTRWLRKTDSPIEVVRPVPSPGPVPVLTPPGDDMPAIVTNSDAYDDDSGHHEPNTTKWEYLGGERIHIPLEYWNGLNTPAGNPRPYAEIMAVPERPAPATPTAASLEAPVHFTGTIDLRAAG